MESTIFNICRLCTSSGYNYTPIFDENSNSIAEKIHNCLPVVIDPNDRLPAQICKVCLEDLDTSEKLRSRSLEADFILRKQLEDFPLSSTEKQNNPHFLALKIERDLDCSFDEFETANEPEEQSTCHDQSDNDDLNNSATLITPKLEIRLNSDEEEGFRGFDQSTINNGVIECSIEIKKECDDESTTDEDNAQCEVCGLRIKDKELRQFHGKFHESRPMDCYTCWHTFPSPYELYIHKKNDHAKFINTEIKWFCDKCEKMSDNSEWARRHMTQCEKQKFKYRCNYCNQEFVYKKEFLAHQRKEHYSIILKDPNFEKFICKFCKKSYTDKRSYHRHIRDHESKKKGKVQRKLNCPKYCCSQCGAGFQQQRLLRDHVNIHTGARPYSCKPCNKTFRTYSGFHSHRQIHKNDTFYCNYCRQIFTNKRTLSDHIAKHEAPENWHHSCDICNIKFPVRGILERHLKKFKKTHLLNCDVCGMELLGLHRLEKHRRLKHKITEMTEDCAVKKEVE